MGLGYPYEVRDFRELELAQPLASVRWILLAAQHMQCAGDLRPLLGDLNIKSVLQLIAHFANYFPEVFTFEKMALRLSFTKLSSDSQPAARHLRLTTS